eukprot:Clim_evm10s166 gene=Clim_evmTU10s166
MVVDSRTKALLATAIHFLVLGSHYMLAPVRDEQGTISGTDVLPYLFYVSMFTTLAFNPLLAVLLKNLPLQLLVPGIYTGLALILLGFSTVFAATDVDDRSVYMAYAFYVYCGFYSVCVTSLFWSAMGDLFSEEESLTYFGMVAFGGTCGQVAGSFLTAELVTYSGFSSAILAAAVTVILAGFITFYLETVKARELKEQERIERQKIQKARKQQQRSETADGSNKRDSSAGVRLANSPSSVNLAADDMKDAGVWEGIYLVLDSRFLIDICLHMLLASCMSSFMYFELQNLFTHVIESNKERTAVRAWMNTVGGIATASFQMLGTSILLRTFGVGVGLSVVPYLSILQYSYMTREATEYFSSVIPTGMDRVIIAAGLEIARRTLTYGLLKPARESLFTVVTRKEKYIAKNLVDTFIHRAGDTMAAGLFQITLAYESALFQHGIALIGGISWIYTSYELGETYTLKKDQVAKDKKE